MHDAKDQVVVATDSYSGYPGILVAKISQKEVVKAVKVYAVGALAGQETL
jgi:hypothetical protein